MNTSISDAPSEFTASSIKAFLINKGMGAVINSYALAAILSSVSQRTIRNHTNQGKLKRIPGTGRNYVYSIDDVVNWIMKNPGIIAQRGITRGEDMTNDKAIELTNHIRNMVNLSWRSLLKYMEMEDIISEVLCKYVTSRKSDIADSTFIFNTLKNIYNFHQRRIRLEFVENTENMDSSDDDEY